MKHAAVRSRATPVALGVLVGLGAVLRLWRLGAAPLNFDESFTAMTGRLPAGAIFGFLRLHDSHPPLDYLLQLPLARFGANAFLFRLPTALCSIAALALFAFWMRDRGRVGIVATGAMAICSFQLLYAREARMYGPMALIGVSAAVCAEAWLRNPRRRHAAVIGALTFVGMMTHVSMMLLAIGLFALAGIRRDANAWSWRGGIAAGAAAWGVLWGPSFVTQARGGHSSWIPHTTPMRFVRVIGALLASGHGVSVVAFVVIVAGCVLCWKRDRRLAVVLSCCFPVPASLAAIIGLHAPVLIGRTLMLVAWGPLLAFGYVVDAAARIARPLGLATVAVAAAFMLSTAGPALTPGGPTTALTELEHVARAGDVLAIQPLSKGVELDWTFAVRSDDGAASAVRIPGIDNVAALDLTSHSSTGRIWLMQFTTRKIDLRPYRLCAPIWHRGASRMLCLRKKTAPAFTDVSRPTITAIYADHTPIRRATRRR